MIVGLHCETFASYSYNHENLVDMRIIRNFKKKAKSPKADIDFNTFKPQTSLMV